MTSYQASHLERLSNNLSMTCLKQMHMIYINEKKNSKFDTNVQIYMHNISTLALLH